MDIKQYIFPIYSGGTIIGQCFIADGYLITAAHVIKDFPACSTRINGKRFEFPKVYSVTEEPFVVGEEPFLIGGGDYNHDSTSLDIVMFRRDDVHSPLHLSTHVLQKGEKFDNYCLHGVMDFSLLNPPCELRMVPAIVRGEEEGNYFYCDCKQFGGSSGSPLLKGNEVVGIMHGGDDNGLCAFLKAQIITERLPQMELDSLDLDVSSWDLEEAWDDNGCKYSADKKRLLKGYDDNIREGTIVICNEAFYRRAGNNIIIPNTVKIIGEKAFAESRELESIKIPDSVTKIGDEAFWCCTFLKRVFLPNSITRIGKNMFGGCQSLEQVIIPNSVIQIDDFAFDGCEELSEFVIPGSVKYIGNDVFFECKSLNWVRLPESIVKIGRNVFDGCDSLTEIIIPSGTKKKFEELLPEYTEILVEETPEKQNPWTPVGDSNNQGDRNFDSR